MSLRSKNKPRRMLDETPMSQSNGTGGEIRPFTAPPDGNDLPPGVVYYVSYYNDEVVKRIFNALNPRLKPLEDWHEKHVNRFRPLHSLQAPITIILWELIKHFIFGKPL